MLHWPPSWRFAPNIKPKRWYLSVSGPETQQSAIFRQRRHAGDRCTYQQAANQHFFVKSAFSEKTNPESSFYILELSYFSTADSNLFDWQMQNNLTKTMLFTGLAAEIHCQSGFAPSTAGFYPPSAATPHSWRLPEVTERAPDEAAAPCYSQRNPGKPKAMLEEISLQAILVFSSCNNRN